MHFYFSKIDTAEWLDIYHTSMRIHVQVTSICSRRFAGGERLFVERWFRKNCFFFCFIFPFDKHSGKAQTAGRLRYEFIGRAPRTYVVRPYTAVISYEPYDFAIVFREIGFYYYYYFLFSWRKTSFRLETDARCIIEGESRTVIKTDKNERKPEVTITTTGPIYGRV